MPYETVLPQLVVNGIISGGIYAILAVGLNVIFGVMEVVNFAQGEFMMLGMYAGYFFFTLLGLQPLLAAIPVFFIFFIIGVLIDKGLMARIRDEGQNSQVLLTIGLSILLINAANFFWTANNKSIDVAYSGQSIDLFRTHFNIAGLIALGFSLLSLGTLAIFFRRTRFGTAIRAVSQDRDLAAVSGISKRRAYTFTFGLSIALTAVAGLMLLPLSSVYPTIGQDYILFGFVVIVLGGLGSFWGAMWGSLLIGLIQSFSTYYVGGWSYVIVFSLFVLILLFKPQGLMGKRVRI
ncbi:MAG: branched-chain amino acid ABC transporter permease [Thaumarchaeota archaeon]|nr:branched-chain amino acid ABC transporter permease [Nitrososphaerota archaeon]